MPPPSLWQGEDIQVSCSITAGMFLLLILMTLFWFFWTGQTAPAPYYDYYDYSDNDLDNLGYNGDYSHFNYS